MGRHIVVKDCVGLIREGIHSTGTEAGLVGVGMGHGLCKLVMARLGLVLQVGVCLE